MNFDQVDKILSDDNREYTGREVRERLNAAGYVIVAADQSADIAERLRRIRRTSEMSANIMRDTKRTGRWEGAEKVARQFDRMAELASPPSDGEIYAAVSRRAQTDVEIDEMFAAIERKLNASL